MAKGLTALGMGEGERCVFHWLFVCVPEHLPHADGVVGVQVPSVLAAIEFTSHSGSQW